jgi:hypothetical protein
MFVQSGWDKGCWELVLELLNDGALYFLTDRVNVPEQYKAVAAAEESDTEEESEAGEGS